MAKKKIYPTLWWLFKDDLIPEKTYFLGYARSKLDIKEFLTKTAYQYMKVKADEQEKFAKFVEKNYYLAGSYDQDSSFKELNNEIIKLSKIKPSNGSPNSKNIVFDDANRIFYLALPPSVYASVLELLSVNCKAVKPHFTRVIVEKPFGKDLESSNRLSVHLSRLFTEDEIYRIDHYLGKEMVQNLIVLRFSNRMFNRVWNRDSIECVMITFKEPFGTEGRGGYFDEFGIIR